MRWLAVLALIALAGCTTERKIYRPVYVHDTLYVAPASCADSCWARCQGTKDPADCMEDCVRARCLPRR